VSGTEIIRLNTALDDLAYEMKQQAPNQSRVRQTVSSIRNVAEGAVGSLAATGILYELAKLPDGVSQFRVVKQLLTSG